MPPDDSLQAAMLPYQITAAFNEQEVQARLEQLCPLSASSSSIIAVLRHDWQPSDVINQKSVIFLRDSADKTVMQLVNEYKARVPEASSITLRAYPDSKPLSPHIKIASLTQTKLLVLCAIEEQRSHSVGDLDSICGKLWPAYATRLTIELAEKKDDSSPKEIQGAIAQKWLTDDGISIIKLDKQTEQLKKVIHDEIELRSFFILHNRLWAVSASLQSRHEAVDEDVVFEAALAQWQNRNPGDMSKLKGDAAFSLEKFPLPVVPTNAPAFFANDVEDNTDEEDEQEEMHDQDQASAQKWSNLGGEKLATQLKGELAFLTNLLQALLAYDSDLFRLQITQIEQALREDQRQGIKIGIVGATGAGKSALVNSLLDEKRFIPTSCWRACTAVVTEISANEDTRHPYRACVNFVDAASWKQDLKVGFAEIDELRDGDHTIEGNSTSPEAGVAWDKISAVYPALERDQLVAKNIPNLLKHPSVVDILGQQKTFEAKSAAKLHRSLREFVDSKERFGAKKVKQDATPDFWPLIKSVQLFSPCPLLACGVTLVDLPGVQDSNRARAAVAQRYLQECSHVWVVAPLTRAVDDKSAKDLLGQTFKRQLTLDGNYTAISFIGSKSDEIGPEHEVAPAFGLEKALAALEADRQRLAADLANLRDEHKSTTSLQNKYESNALGIETEIRLYESLADQCGEAGTVVSPKRITSGRFKRKRNDDVMEGNLSSGIDQNSDRQRITKQDIDLKLRELHGTLGGLVADVERLEDRLGSVEQQIKATEANIQAIPGKKWRLCIATRNATARSAIKSDFVGGLREYEDDIRQEAGDFDPELDCATDYGQLESQLPVFCVSSRGFQRLRGIIKDDHRTDHFDHEDQTEIPALKEHAARLGNAAREATLKRRLNNIAITINNLKIWFHGTGVIAALTEEQILQENANVKTLAEKLRSELTGIATGTVTSIQSTINDNIFRTLPYAADKAKNQAMAVSNGWALPFEEGGLRWGTYKAIVRRDGVYTNKIAHRDFNDQLIQPMMVGVTHGWATTFRNRLPPIIQSSSNAAEGKLMEFHSKVHASALQAGVADSVNQILSTQIAKQKERVKDAFDVLRSDIVSKQKEANRAFLPVVQSNMRPAYEAATAVHGKGSFKLMKNMVMQQVQAVQNSMFDAASNAVQRLLKAMVASGAAALSNSLNLVVDDLESDCLNIIGQGHELSETDEIFCAEICAMLTEREPEPEPEPEHEHEHEHDAPSMDEISSLDRIKEERFD